MPLYHYTGVQAVYSILENKKIWLTDIRFLNDSQELHDGLDILTEQLKNPMAGLFSDFNHVDEAIEYIRRAFEEHVSFGTEEEPIFVFSLSSRKDVLSQWRAYGSYAIEFDEDLLREEIKNLEPCIYKTKDKTSKAAANVTKAIMAVSQDMGENNGCLGSNSIDALTNLVSDAATFKNIGFREEDESRIILSSGNHETPPSTKYRSRGDLLIPYIELDVPIDCIKSIQVGPMKDQDLAYASMKDFVSKIEKKWQNDSGDIEYQLSIERSDIPYRDQSKSL